MVVQYTESETFVPSVKNPYEDMNYNDCDLLPPNLSILIDAISTQGKMEDCSNDEENVDINALDNEPSPLLNHNNSNNNNNNNNSDGFVINHTYDLNNNNNIFNHHIESKDDKYHNQHPCSSLKDYEISKLPLRKRHLVPDSAYYNIHQCLSSPQSPPTPKQSILNPFGNGSLMGEYNEQRVPSPNSGGTSLAAPSTPVTKTSQLPDLVKLPSPKLTEEDDVDVEGDDDDDILPKPHIAEATSTTTTTASIAAAPNTPSVIKHNDSTNHHNHHTHNHNHNHHTVVKAENTLVKVESDQELEVDILMDDEDSRVKEMPSNHVVKREKEREKEREKDKSHHHHGSSHHHDSKKRSKPSSSSSSLPSSKKDKEHRDGHKKLKVHHGGLRLPRDNFTDDSDSDSLSSDSEEERSRDNRLYCTCRKKYDSNSFMIACDKCDEWYHGECVNISEKDAKKIDRYVCQKCKKKSLHNLNINNNNSNNNTHNTNTKESTTINSPRTSPNHISQKSPSLTNSPFIDINSPPTPPNQGIKISSSSNTSNSSPPHSVIVTKPDLKKCAYAKCNSFSNGSSKYCSKECGVANAKEILNKNPNLKRSILATGSPSGNTITTVVTSSPQKTSPPISDTNPLTQKLMSTSNCDDISKLKAITLKRSEIESKLKKLEMKCSEFEKTIQMTKFKVESLSTPDMYSNNNHSNNIKNNLSNSPSHHTPCTFPLQESPNGICGVLNCTNHVNWEKRKRDLFSKEQSYYTKALRDIALEEKQIHQRIARRNKIANLSTIAIGGEPEY